MRNQQIFNIALIFLLKNLTLKLIFFCRLMNNSKIAKFDYSNSVSISTVFGLSINVYNTGNDAVSNNIINAKSWESDIIDIILNSLEEFALIKKLFKSDVYFLDIGANLGMFSLAVANRGFKVLSFEANLDNSLLIQKSLCDQPKLKEKITLYKFGLSDKNLNCLVYSPPQNIANGHVACDINNLRLPPGYNLIGELQTKLLDDIVDDPSIRQRIGAVKIDVEGFEEFVQLGGMKTLLYSNIPLISLEWLPRYIDQKGGNSSMFLERFFDAGYFISFGNDIYRNLTAALSILPDECNIFLLKTS